MTNHELTEAMADAIRRLTECWGEDGEKVVAACWKSRGKPLTADEFLSHCTACGGNWGGMFLSGVRKLWPEVYDAIPDDMGVFAFSNIISILLLCGVDTGEED